MAGYLTPSEEQDLLYSQLSAPLMPSTNADALRDRITNGAPEGPGLLQKLDPALQGAIPAGPGALGALGIGLAAKGIGRKLEGATASPFEKGGDGYAPTITRGEELRPMDTPLANVTPAPPLNPAYAQAGRMAGGAPGMGGGGLYGDFRDAQRSQLQTLRGAQGLEKNLGEEKAGRIESVSQLEQTEAARQIAEAKEQQKIDQDASARMHAFLTRNEELANEIGRTQVDPGRLMRSRDIGDQITMSIGAVAGGWLSGVNGGPNEFLKRVDQYVDRDIAAQVHDIDTRKASLNARSTLFGQMLAETGDRRVAAEHTRQHVLEAVKQRLTAQAASLGIPEVRAQTALVVNGIQQKIDTLDLGNKESAWKLAQAQAAAAASAQRAAEEREWQRKKDVAELMLKGGELRVKELAAGKGHNEEDNKQINEATKRLGDEHLVADEGLIRNMQQHVRPDGSIVGFDMGSRGRMGAVKGLSGGLLPNDATAKIALTDEERIGQQSWRQLGLIFQHKITGAGGNPEEMEKIRAAYEGAGSNAERKAVIDRLAAEMDRRQAYAKAILSDEQKKTLDTRLIREGVGNPMPATVKLK